MHATLLQKWSVLDFHSLLVQWGFLCPPWWLPTLLSTTVMVGGVVGAICCGFVADRIGRRPVLIGTLFGVGLINGLVACLGDLHWPSTIMLLFFLGSMGGGFMVTNLVLALESVGDQYWRLFVVAFNGWPLGLMFMAMTGHVTKDWRSYHAVLSVLGLLLAGLCVCVTKESARWLYQHERVAQAMEILREVALINGKAQQWRHLMDRKRNDSSSSSSPTKTVNRKYNYLDLARHRSVYILLAVLFYSWLVSSIVSFGIYFNLAILPGNRFLKLFITGLFKAITGSIPFLLNRYVGRRPIFIGGNSPLTSVLLICTILCPHSNALLSATLPASVSVAIACVSCWAVVVVYSLVDISVLLTVFTVLGTAAIDPIWKVNHLYSTELFPTVIRNMARAVCNVGSRMGSVVAPWLVSLHHINLSLPYVIFGSLVLIQMVIGTVFLPETRNADLPDQLPEKNGQLNGKKTSEPNELTAL